MRAATGARMQCASGDLRAQCSRQPGRQRAARLASRTRRRAPWVVRGAPRTARSAGRRWAGDHRLGDGHRRRARDGRDRGDAWLERLQPGSVARPERPHRGSGRLPPTLDPPRGRRRALDRAAEPRSRGRTDRTSRRAPAGAPRVPTISGLQRGAPRGPSPTPPPRAVVGLAGTCARGGGGGAR